MHILIVKLGSIGDVVHTMPAVAVLRDSFPEAKLTWIVESLSAPLIVGSPILDQVIMIDTKKWRRSLGQFSTWTQIREVFSKLRKEKIDIAIDFQGLVKSSFVTYLSKARERIGFEPQILREPVSRFGYTRQIPIKSSQHVIENNISLACAIGAKRTEGYKFYFPDIKEQITDISIKLANHDIERFALLNPGGGWITKLWPAEKYAELADLLWEQFHLKSVVTCGPGEISIANTILAHSISKQVTYFPTSLLEFIALVCRASIFVGSDTGPLHIAAACKTPIVGIYGPTDPNRNGPFDLLDQIVGLDIPCRVNCYRRICNKHICMDINVKLVAEAIMKRISLTNFNSINRY